MREKVEALMRDYPRKKMELDCLHHQLQNFCIFSENDLIDSMAFSHPGGERVATSKISDRTATVAVMYRERMDAINRGWYQHLEKQFVVLADELFFFEAAIKALQGTVGLVVRDMIFERISWDDIAEKHYISRATIARYRKKGIDALVSLYEKREADKLAYMKTNIDS